MKEIARVNFCLFVSFSNEIPYRISRRLYAIISANERLKLETGLQSDFWHKMWASGVVGFHQPAVNSYLQQHWQSLLTKQNLENAGEVLVPLSGKTLDMLWLKEQGHSVLAVELSQKALDEFVEENDLHRRYKIQDLEHQRFCGFQLEALRLFCGDFFHLTAEDCQNIVVVYDRAALVALPPEMRVDYTQHLLKVLPKNTPMLLIAMDYDQSQTNGPPFAVTEQEIHQLYAEHYQIEKVQEERFSRKGIETVESTYFLMPC